jgi:hypothetical protein
MPMSPREIAIMRLQRTVTPPSLRGEAPAPQPQVADPAAEAGGYKKFYQQTWYKALVGVALIGGAAYAYKRYSSGSSNSSDESHGSFGMQSRGSFYDEPDAYEVEDYDFIG